MQHTERSISSATLETKQECFHSRSSLLQLIDSIIKDIRSDLPEDSIPLRQYQERFDLLARDYSLSVTAELGGQLEELGTVGANLVRSGILFLLSAEKFLILNNQYVFSRHGVHIFSKYDALCGESLELSDHKEVENLEDSIAAIDRMFLFWHDSHYWDLIELDEKEENVDEFVQDIKTMLTLNHEERLAQLKMDSFMRASSFRKLIPDFAQCLQDLTIPFAELALSGTKEKKLHNDLVNPISNRLDLLSELSEYSVEQNASLETINSDKSEELIDMNLLIESGLIPCDEINFQTLKDSFSGVAVALI